ncbi:MAG TPA: IclR family transcriptional regulator [Clostridia bacterium]|nr:IclR family transcriptional regulator [Clostridia bacterium]
MNKSASRAIDIIDFIAKQDSSVTITEISHKLGIPKSSTFELLYTLLEKGYLQIEDENLKTFKLGIKLFQSGTAYLKKMDLNREARPLLEDMMKNSGETVFLAVEVNGMTVYLDKVEGSSSTRTTSVLGSSNPMYCTGLGKALLAAYSDNRIKEITGGSELPLITEYTIKSYDELIVDLKGIRSRGYAIDDRENEEDVFCVAAPIYDRSGKPIAAISIASLASKINSDRLEQFGKLVSDTALDISKRLGYARDKLYFY